MKIHVHATASPERGDDRVRRWSEIRTESRRSAVSYRETPTALELKIDMPGAEPQGLDLTLKGRRLTVRFERKSESRTRGEDRERVETVREVLTKEIELPTQVDPESADAVFKHGVLHITLRKLG